MAKEPRRVWQCDDCKFEWKPIRNWTRKDPVKCKSCKSTHIHPKKDA